MKFVLSTLPLEFVDTIDITDFEIHYIAESRYGDVLKIYRKISENNIAFQIVKNGNIVTRGCVWYKRRL